MKRLILLINVILFISCTTKPSTALESLSSYKLKFSKISKLEKMPKGLYGMSYVTDGEYIYVINGKSHLNLMTKAISVNNKDIFAYNIETNKWFIYPDNLNAKVYGNAEYIDRNIYIFNGQYQINDGYTIREGANKKVEVFNTKTNNVSIIENNPFPAYQAGSAKWNGKVYVFGGALSQHLISNNLLEYDPKTDEWKRLSDIPYRGQVKGEIIDGVLYIFGGRLGNRRSSKDIYSYDISNDTWNYIGEMPKRLSANAITIHSEFIWLIGDYSNLSRVSVFNTKTNEFINIKSNLLGRRYAGAEIIGNKLFVFGGARESRNSYMHSIQVADITEIEKIISSNRIESNMPY
ncbi:Kelch repeat-containing protein [Candidatus Neomarinimicrobiota bacterium]